MMTAPCRPPLLRTMLEGIVLLGAMAAGGGACSEGEGAVAACPAGLQDCGGQCVDTKTDSAHCGSCIQACGGGLVCSDGACRGACLGGERLCAGSCVDTASDRSHCGACDMPCSGGMVCSAGACAGACGAATTECDGICVNVLNDADHCGGCNMPCASPASCVSGACSTELHASCLELLSAVPGAPSGEYNIDPDGDGALGPVGVHCDMSTDGGGYTWLRVDDMTLGQSQAPYGDACDARGLEIIVTRTGGHAKALYDYNASEPANLVNVYPTYNGAMGIFTWQALCRGLPCNFWMTDDVSGNVGCLAFEPNGNNNISYRIFRTGPGCGVQGRWDDAFDNVWIRGWVICSTNDK